ncbi:MAG: glycosyltransferase [Ignavibacteria bacterium]|nr:glycosyltransferase [Ignavibacteria bacterium]
MNQILIIAYYFPPSGGPGVQRVLKYTKYLPEFGWEPVVLTVEKGSFPALDYSLLEEIPENVKVFRTKIFEPHNLYRKLLGKPKDSAIDVNVIKKDDQKITLKERFAEFFRSTFFIPDARIGWFFFAIKKAKEIIKNFNIKVIYTSSPPYTCSLIGKWIKKKFGIPWIAGFRDPWTGFISAPKRWLVPALIDKYLEFSVFNEADLVEVAWEGIAKDALTKYPTLSVEKFIHIPNGYDPADFPKLEYKPNPVFTLTYTGSMYGRRNPESLFKALEKLLEKGIIRSEDFVIKLIGRFGDEVKEMINKTKIKKSIQTFTYLPHSESLKHLLSSDALLLIVDESKESEEIVPGKVFEYLGTFKPILAIAPKKGAIAKLLEKTKSGFVAHQSEIDEIGKNFLQIFNLWKSNVKFEPNYEEIKKYSRKEHTKIFSELLFQLTI